jgi:hypothetical protein
MNSFNACSLRLNSHIQEMARTCPPSQRHTRGFTACPHGHAGVSRARRRQRLAASKYGVIFLKDMDLHEKVANSGTTINATHYKFRISRHLQLWTSPASPVTSILMYIWSLEHHSLERTYSRTLLEQSAPYPFQVLQSNLIPNHRLI